MLRRHAAHAALPLAAGHRQDQARRLLGGLAQGKHYLGNPSSQIAPEVEAGSSCEVLELDAAQLVKRPALGELACPEPAQDVLPSPGNTPRMCCRGVPAQ